MKKLLLILVTIFLPMVASSHEFSVENADGVTIYYNYTNDGKELEVTHHEMSDYSDYKYKGSVVIPEEVTYMNRTRKVTSIGEEAFKYCYNLTSVTFPTTIKSFGRNSFWGCHGLTSISIPNSVTNIGDGAFGDCSSLKSITISNSVTTIGALAFNGCKSLTSVTIPNSVTYIGSFAFYDCTGLTSVTIPNSVTVIGGGAFGGCNLPVVISLIENPTEITGKAYDTRTFSQNTFNNATLYVPVGTIDKYKATEGWKDFLFIEEGTGGGGNTPEKCATPTITYEDGKLSFSCDTEGVEYVTNVECLDNKTFTGNEIQLSGKYRVSVYATKAGFDNSDVATEEIEVLGMKGDINGDGEVNVTDIVTLVNIIMSGDSQ